MFWTFKLRFDEDILAILTILGHFGAFWGILGHFWPCLAIFGHFGHFWPFLAVYGHFGPFGGIWGHFGPFWASFWQFFAWQLSWLLSKFGLLFFILMVILNGKTVTVMSANFVNVDEPKIARFV